MGDGVAIDEDLAATLVAEQFPEWGALPVRPVAHGGHDNRTFRLGDDMLVRMPSAAGYQAAVAKEQRWLPILAPDLPLPIPEPLAAGVPSRAYPWPWSVYRWLPGDTAERAPLADEARFARDLAAFLVALRAQDPGEAPGPGPHSFFRGAPLDVYDVEARQAFERLALPRAVGRLFDEALASTWGRGPVWFHGDVAPGNLLVDGGELSAVIDFGTSGVGDPACDLVIAWTFFGDRAAAAFRDSTGLDDATWARARGWALWKAAITDDRATVARVLGSAP